MSAENARLLALLEQGHAEAQIEIAALRQFWHEEDLAIAAHRKAVWAAHEQGARDRDAKRVELGGRSLIEADARAAEAAAAARLKAADDETAALAASQAKAVPAEGASPKAAAQSKVEAAAA